MMTRSDSGRLRAAAGAGMIAAMRYALSVAVAGLNAGCADAFVAWPTLDPGTRSVILGRSCGAEPSMKALEAAALDREVVKEESCEAARYTLLELDRTLEDNGLVEGELRPERVSVCATRLLPEAHRSWVLELGAAEREPREVAELPDPERSFRFRIPCPCNDELVEIRRVTLESPAAFVFAKPLDDESVLLIATGPGGLTKFFRYDLDTLELVASATVGERTERLQSTEPGEENGIPVEGGIYGVSGTGQRLVMGGNEGRIYAYEPKKGLSLAYTIPSGGEVIAVSKSMDEGPEEVFALTRYPTGIWRVFAGGAKEYPYLRARDPDSRRSRVLWTGRGRAVAVPLLSESIFFIEGDQIMERAWEPDVAIIRMGQPQALGLTRSLGALVATKGNWVVALDQSRDTLWTEIKGVDGARMSPVAGWFSVVFEYADGFIVFNDRRGLVRYSSSFGFCPEQTFADSSTLLSSPAMLGDAIVLGGDSKQAYWDGALATVLTVAPLSAR